VELLPGLLRLLPLYIFCGRHLLAAKLRRDASAGSIEQVERIVEQIRARWPYVRILLRADMADRTSFTPETTSPELNERDQSPTKTRQNQRSRPLSSRS